MLTMPRCGAHPKIYFPPTNAILLREPAIILPNEKHPALSGKNGLP